MNNPRDLGVPKERKTERSNEKFGRYKYPTKKSVYLTDGSHYFVPQIWSTRFWLFFRSSNSGHHLGFSWRYDDAKEQGKRLGETPFWGYDTTK